MAWIEFHQSLREHPKLYAACGELDTIRPHLAGHLGFLWLWAMDYAMDGDLTKFSDVQIAAAAQWPSNPQKFIAALVKHGFIEQMNRKRRIHDWFDFCGEIVKKRMARRQERRTKSAEIRRKAPKGRLPTVPTVPTVPTNTAPAGAFELIWAQYPNKLGRKRAEQHFNGSVKTMQDFLDIQNALDNFRKRMAGKDPDYIPHGKTWFNNWRDDISYKGPSVPPPPRILINPPPVEIAQDFSEADLRKMHDDKKGTLGCRAKDCAYCAKDASVDATTH